MTNTSTMSYNNNYGGNPYVKSQTAHGGDDGYGDGGFSDNNYSGGHKDPNVHKLQSELDNVHEIMQKNISSVLERGEHLDDMRDRTHELQEQTTIFKSSATATSRKMRWRNMKWKIIIALVVILIVVICIVGKYYPLLYSEC
ncbi:Vesicle-associated membrane protein 4 [Coemansia spiralis]|uniref:Vesicle-associated membrane protein 4 n=1 Tax=Coemansia spiralis TaxID=417178 RepID=A0A9W8GB33_9FUNG|nr:Vesicle-associated membrane protein 4 [Coemansia spiralis]